MASEGCHGCKRFERRVAVAEDHTETIRGSATDIGTFAMHYRDASMAYLMDEDERREHFLFAQGNAERLFDEAEEREASVVERLEAEFAETCGGRVPVKIGPITVGSVCGLSYAAIYLPEQLTGQQ